MKVDAATGASAPLFDAGEDGSRAGRAARRRGRRRAAGSLARAISIFNQRHSRGRSSRSRDDLYLYVFGDGPRRPADVRAGRRRASRRSARTVEGRVRPRATTCSSSTSRPAAKRALTTDGAAEDPERQARLGVRGRDLRPRRTARVLVEPGFVAARVPPLDDTPGPDLHHASTTSATTRASRRGTTRKAGDPNPTVKLGVVARRRRPATSLDRHVEVPGADFLIVRVAWTPDGRAWSTRCRTARRRGST